MEGEPQYCTRFSSLPHCPSSAPQTPADAPALAHVPARCPSARLYHVREPETQVLQLAFPEFVKCSAAWRTRRLYMRVRAGMGGVVVVGR